MRLKRQALNPDDCFFEIVQGDADRLVLRTIYRTRCESTDRELSRAEQLAAGYVVELWNRMARSAEPRAVRLEGLRAKAAVLAHTMNVEILSRAPEDVRAELGAYVVRQLDAFVTGPVALEQLDAVAAPDQIGPHSWIGADGSFYRCHGTTGCLRCALVEIGRAERKTGRGFLRLLVMLLVVGVPVFFDAVQHPPPAGWAILPGAWRLAGELIGRTAHGLITTAAITLMGLNLWDLYRRWRRPDIPGQLPDAKRAEAL